MFFKYLSTIIPRFFKKWELLDIRGGRLFRTQIFQSVVCVFQICILSLTQQKCNSLGSSGGQTCHPFFDLWGSQDIAFVSATQFILYILVPIHMCVYLCMGVENWKGAREYLKNNILFIRCPSSSSPSMSMYDILSVLNMRYVKKWISSDVVRLCTSSKFSRETDMHGYSRYNIILFCLIFYSLAKRSVNFRDDICLCDTKNLRFKVLLFQNSHAYIKILKKNV